MADLRGIFFAFADVATDALNPAFMVLILEEPLLLRRASERAVAGKTARFWARALLGVGVAVVLAELGKKYQVWPGHPSFPSGHTTFAAAAATCLVLQRGRSWLWLTVPMVLVMGAGLIYCHWHTADEVAAALLLGPTVAWGLWRLSGGRPAPHASSASE